MNKIRQGPMENLLDGLTQHAELLSDEELRVELKDRGIDVDEFLNEVRSIADDCLKADRLAWMKTADEKKQRMGTIEAGIKSWLEKGPVRISEAWTTFLKTVGQQQALAFRNRTDLTLEDKARILDDFERLRLRQAEEAKREP